MYTTDLATILQLLREFRRSGLLQAELPGGLPRLKQPCLIVIELLRGEMTSCHVKDTRGTTLLANQEALQAISKLGKLTWVVDALPEQEWTNQQQISGLPPHAFQATPSQHTGVLPSVAAVPKAPTNIFHMPSVPRRLVHLSPAEINSWPRRHRQVYVLVDGLRSVEQIATMLSQPAHIVEETLREIQSTRAIILE